MGILYFRNIFYELGVIVWLYHLHSSIDAVHLFNEQYKRHNTIFIDLNVNWANLSFQT